ncbi:MAG TPA: DUF1573 domain-containing protein [Verrucomicrobia bacterium]|nr:DUF1573 domain-containing protein [Verrucomicrobiota bacterium]HOB32475.1 DUF1573 domain-containing protein [Verrucomicrobiota bacterium]HOP98422.1 DUF1573 domain-containing protein [Verrucomicrobiota bacterium]
MKHGARFLIVLNAIGLCLIALGASGTATNNPAPLHNVPSPVHPASEPDKFLKWDSITKEQTILEGTNLAHFTFYVTNVSTATVTIQEVYTSCGCTAAELPQQPWPLAPGDTGKVSVAMDVAGLTEGVIIRTVTLLTDKGHQVLYVKTTVLSETNAASQPVPAASIQQ